MAIKQVRNYFLSDLVSGTFKSKELADKAEADFYSTEQGKQKLTEQSAIDKLSKQILSQNTVDKWSGQGFGSAEANAKDMARILTSIGITDIKQFGEVKKTVPADVQYTVPGVGVVERRGDTFYKTISVEYGDGGSYEQAVPLAAEEAKNVKTTYGRYVGGVVGEGDNQQYVTNFEPVDPTKIVTKDGVPSIETGETTFGNKATGQQVPNTYSERQTGNAWGGTFAGDGNTGYRVQFTPDGTPVFYTTEASSSDLGSLMPIISVALMATGAGAGLGAALMGGSSVAATALGSGIISGVMAEATGGDFIKGAITGAVGAGIGAYAGDIGAALGVTDPAMAKAVGSAVLSGAASEATGGDFITGAVSGALSAGAGKLAGEALGLEGMTASTVGTSLVKGVVAELQGKDVTDAMIAGAVSGALSYKEPPKAADVAFEEDFADMMAGKFTIDEVSSGQDITATADADAMFVPKEDATSNISDSVTDFLSNKTDYSLTSGITFPSTEGLKVEPITDAGATVGESPVDYSLNIDVPFEGLQMPTSSNIDSMGGGQGLTVKTPEGVLSESGVTTTGTASDLGDPNSFINKPAPDVPDQSSVNAKEALKLAMKMFGAVGVGGAAFNAVSSDTSKRQPVNLEYGDIYKDAPIKGFAMRKGEDGKYTPYIGEKAQLAKGGLASRRN